MKPFTKAKDKRTELEKERDDAIDELRCMTWAVYVEKQQKDESWISVRTANPDYEQQLNRIERLNELIKEKHKQKINPDTVLLTATNILGIILIIGHEKVNVITSKALGFVMRGRV